jgi:hypothetical protein
MKKFVHWWYVADFCLEWLACFLEMMWKNMAEPDTLQVTVCGACALHAGWRSLPPTHARTHAHTHARTYTHTLSLSLSPPFIIRNPCWFSMRSGYAKAPNFVHCLSSSITGVFSIWPIWTKCKGTYFLGMQYLSDRFLFAIMTLFWVLVDIVPRHASQRAQWCVRPTPN